VASVTEPPRDTDEPLIVIDELVRDEFAIFDNVLLEPDIVLLVRVCAVFKSTVTVVSMLKVTSPDVPPPERPVLAVTPVISPGLGADHVSPEVVAESTDKTYPAVEATGKIT
jgi:hypothetical protein